MRFTRHAAERLTQRFGGSVEGLIEVVERGIYEKGAEPAPESCWKVEGFVEGRPARVVYSEPALGEIKIVTVMWCN